MNDYSKLIEDARLRSIAERDAAALAEKSRKQESAARLAAARERMEVHAKPEFIKACEALVAAGVPAVVELVETLSTPLQSAIIRLSIAASGREYRAELHGSSNHGISAHLYAPASESHLGTCEESGDLREHAASLLARFVSSIPILP